MNPKFYSLPKEKQLKIINAGYRIFSQNSYKKSPMSEIASYAGISKSLLFYYFKNKKELYLFLLKNAEETTLTHLHDYQCYDEEDFFEIMRKGLKAKVKMIKKYPDLAAFTIKGYYETNEEIVSEIQEIIGRNVSFKRNAEKFKLNPDQFIPNLDLKMMYLDIYLASEGYLFEKTQQSKFDVDMVEKDFERLIEFWKSIYLKKENSDESN